MESPIQMQPKKKILRKTSNRIINRQNKKINWILNLSDSIIVTCVHRETGNEFYYKSINTMKIITMLESLKQS